MANTNEEKVMETEEIEEATVEVEKKENFVTRFVNKHPKTAKAIGIGLILGAIGGTAYAVKTVKNKNKEDEETELVEEEA